MTESRSENSLSRGAKATDVRELAAKRLNAASPTDAFLLNGFERHSIVTAAGKMVYYEAGSGEPMIFLHGIGGGASSWTWNRVAPDFSDSFRVVVPDWVGWGESEHPARFLRFEDYVQSLEVMLEHLGAKATIVAQSLACGFAAALAERRPELVRRFVFNTPSGGRDFGKDAFGVFARLLITPAAKTPSVNILFYNALFHRRRFISGWLKREGFFDAAEVTGEVVEGFLYSARKANAAFSALPFASGDLRYDFAPYLSRLSVPTSVFWGAHESQVGREVRDRLAAMRQDVPLTLINNAKACPELERPRDVVDVIRQSLDRSRLSPQ